MSTHQPPSPPPLALDLTPVEVATGLRHLDGFAFLDTSLETSNGDPLSIVAACPSEVIDGHDWAALDSMVSNHMQTKKPNQPLPAGAAIGFIDYDGEFRFGIYDELLIYEHRAQQWHGSGNLSEELITTRCDPLGKPLGFDPQTSREDYCRMVAVAKEYIAAGDIYQVNLAHRFSAKWPDSNSRKHDAFPFYRKLRSQSPAPYAAFLDTGDRQVLSSSPECFLHIQGDQIKTRPIKGTRPRKSDPAADERSAYDLITSAKEIAELVMITDLERNDLGQVCNYGSVRVPELLKLERFEQVFHLVSTVTGEMEPSVSHVKALQACFPGGSITGAPKKRAMEIIAELEPKPRGLYTGAIGYFGFNGTSDFNIAIRTVVAEHDELSFHVGAGIVADSLPEKEYQETLDKAAGILLAARG